MQDPFRRRRKVVHDHGTREFGRRLPLHLRPVARPHQDALPHARDEFNLDLAQCHIVGDKLIDLECGWNAGVKKSILVRTGYGKEVERDAAGKISQAVVVDGLKETADWILKQC